MTELQGLELIGFFNRLSIIILAATLIIRRK